MVQNYILNHFEALLIVALGLAYVVWFLCEPENRTNIAKAIHKIAVAFRRWKFQRQYNRICRIADPVKKAERLSLWSQRLDHYFRLEDFGCTYEEFTRVRIVGTLVAEVRSARDELLCPECRNVTLMIRTLEKVDLLCKEYDLGHEEIGLWQFQIDEIKDRIPRVRSAWTLPPLGSATYAR